MQPTFGQTSDQMSASELRSRAAGGSNGGGGGGGGALAERRGSDIWGGGGGSESVVRGLTSCSPWDDDAGGTRTSQGVAGGRAGGVVAWGAGSRRGVEALRPEEGGVSPAANDAAVC